MVTSAERQEMVGTLRAVLVAALILGVTLAVGLPLTSRSSTSTPQVPAKPAASAARAAPLAQAPPVSRSGGSVGPATQHPEVSPAISFYTVSFVETGLPDGAFWYLNVSFLSYSRFFATDVSGPVQTVSVSVPDTVTVSYTPLSAGACYPAPSPGSVTVSGANVTVPIAYSSLCPYAVTIEASGLVSGASWSAYSNSTFVVDNFLTAEVSGPLSAVTFFTDNGTFNYSAFTNDPCYTSPSAGSVTVSGSNVVVPISFSSRCPYSVTFIASGLPTDTNWSVTSDTSIVDLPMFNNTTAGSNGTITFLTVNGTFNFSVLPPNPWWWAAPASGSEVVAGTSVTVTLNFARLPVVDLTLKEAGLPTGSTWGINSEQLGESSNTTLSAMVISAPNPVRIHFTAVAPAGYGLYAVIGPGGPVNGGAGGVMDNVTGNASLKLLFGPVENVTFQETGLPAGYYWWVNVTGSSRATPATPPQVQVAGFGANLSLLLVKGGYTYQVGVGAFQFYRAVHGGHGHLGVPAHVLSKSVRFKLLTSKVVFKEFGLASTGVWTLQLTGPEDLTFNHTGSALTLRLIYGLYTFNITSSVPGYYPPLPSSGTIFVKPPTSASVYVVFNRT